MFQIIMGTHDKTNNIIKNIEYLRPLTKCMPLIGNLNSQCELEILCIVLTIHKITFNIYVKFFRCLLSRVRLPAEIWSDCFVRY